MQYNTTFRIPQSSHDNAFIPVFWFTAIFAVVTYAAISARAILSPYEVNYFIDLKRLLSVAAGTLVLWLTIRAAAKVSDLGPGAQLFAVLNIAIPGAIWLLLAREAYDLIASGAFAEKFALNLRWMVTWIGYFAAAVASFIALATHMRLQAMLSVGQNIPNNSPLARNSNMAPNLYEQADIDFDPRF